jgi:hypothetical protein
MATTPTPRRPLRFLPAIALFVAACLTLPDGAIAAPSLSAAAAVFDQSSFPATGTHEAILTITAFGRYAIAVKSSQGTALQLVDRMAGPGDISGAPGAADGRIDTFLERGTYKLRLLSDPRGAGTALLSVTPFAELQGAPVALVENKPVATDLADHRQRSWWLVVSARGTYQFEAGGRYLADLRLWKDGAWLIGASPNVTRADADPAHPLAIDQLTAQLEPGTYRLTAYGGAGLPWADASAAAPFLLRWGVPQLSDAGGTTHVMSGFGVDRFIVPGSATDVRLVLDHAETASVSSQPLSGDVFDMNASNTAGIDKTSRDPVAEITQSAAQTPWLVTVTYRPGAKYRLEIFNAAGTAEFGNDSGNALLAVTLPGDPDDQIDAGFLLVNQGNRVVAASAIDLGSALPWRRRFNLLRPVSTFLYTPRKIDLRISGTGAKAEVVVSRLMTGIEDRVMPVAKPSGGVWPLNPGYYTLSVGPLANGQGILTMSMFEAGHAPPRADSPRLPAPVFSNISLDPNAPDKLYTSLPDDTAYGLRTAFLPAMLDQPLSFELAPGAAETLPLALPADGQVSVTDDDGAALAFSVDGQAATGTADVPAGQHQLSVTNAGKAIADITVADTPVALLPSTALPPIPADEITAPVLQPLQPGQPDFIDLAATQSITFALPVPRDALYRFETTGLLETGGAIRTRTNPVLASVEGNGVGRNFLLEPFLREGDYQLTVSAIGQTAGHAGVNVTETPVTDEGDLALGRAARTTLSPGEAALYHFHLSTAGQYHLFTRGLGHQFAMRLEDKDGWPLITPGGPADVAQYFDPGDYRMILLPGTVQNRAVTMLQQVLPPPAYAGHGPFQVAFGQDMGNRWMEPAPGQPRTPDAWKFTLPAAATVTVTIDPGMRAKILPDVPGAQPVTTVIGNWTGRLSPGNYVVDTFSAAPDNRVDYTLNVSLAELTPGQSRDVQAPVSIPVSLGGFSQYDIESSGDQDVRATLYDSNGKLVAANDDRDNDWNFLISGNFPPGAYRLQVDPVGGASAATTVAISSPPTTRDAVLQPGQTDRFADGAVHVIPLARPAQGALLLAGVSAAVPVSLAMDVQEDGAWRQCAATSGINPTLAVPGGAAADYRLRAWAEDHGTTPVAVTVIAETLAAASPAALTAGLALSPVTLAGQQFGVARIGFSAPAILQVSGAPGTLQWTSAANHPAAGNVTGTIVASGPDLWLLDTSPRQVTAQPADILNAPVQLSLGAGERLAVPLPAARAGAIALWRASAQGGQAGIAVGAAGTSCACLTTPALGAGLATAAFGFQPAGLVNPVLNLWQAGAPVDGLPVTIERHAFPAPVAVSVRTGDNAGALPADAALTASLPGGLNRLALVLPDGAVAVLLAGGQPQTLIAGNGALPDILETQADTLILLNPGPQAAYSLSIQPAARPGLVLARGGLLTRYSATPAVLHVALQDDAAARLRIAGAATDVTAIDARGNVTRGDGAPTGNGGTALVTVAPGLAVISADGAAPEDQNAQTAAIPGSVPLAGAADSIAIPAGPARLLHIETDTPIVLRDDLIGIPTLFPAGAALNLFQPKAARLTLTIRAAGGGTLSGNARIDVIPAIPITDGLGPAAMLAPGAARLFSFSLDAPRAIGVGVRGAVDDASVRLLASDGSQLGAGIIAMRTLPAGTYYLTAEIPPDAPASEIQPTLVGKTLPDDGPPPDVIASYAEQGP